MRKGLFIVLEGIDGSGTSTQTSILERHIQEDLGFDDVSSSWEPWTSDYGLRIRKVLTKDIKISSYELAQLYVWDSVEHNKLELKQVRKRGGIALSDRYRGSSFAYQTADGISPEQVLEMHEREGEKLEIPDLTFFLNSDVEISMKRLAKRNNSEGNAPELFDILEFQKRVNDNYLGIIKQGLKYLGRTIIVNGNLSQEEVSQNINMYFDAFFNQWIKSD
jgi:dTMP kinase